MNDDINEYVPSILNPRTWKKTAGDITLTQNSIISRCSLSLRRNAKSQPNLVKISQTDKENCRNNINKQKPKSHDTYIPRAESIGFSAIEDLITDNNGIIEFSPLCHNEANEVIPVQVTQKPNSIVTVLSNTELGNSPNKSHETVNYDIPTKTVEKALVSLSFGIMNCNSVDIKTKNVNIKGIAVKKNENDVAVDCEIIEGSTVSSTESDCAENMDTETSISPRKRSGVAVNLEIKKKKLTTEDAIEKSKVLILNTDAIEKVSHVIIQPPNYKLVKRQIVNKIKNNSRRTVPHKNGYKLPNKSCGKLKQIKLNEFFHQNSNVNSQKTVVPDDCVENESAYDCQEVKRHEGLEMSKIAGVNDAFKSDRVARSAFHSPKKDFDYSPRLNKQPISHSSSPTTLRRHEVKVSSLDSARASSSKSPRTSPRRSGDLQFSLPSSRVQANKVQSVVKSVPHYKIVAGTHFAVDAFSYGDIPNVKHYFLTHFHSDHYSGLKKSFNKLLFCSKITAELCVSRLGVNQKCIHVINVDETRQIDGVEVTAVDANHCPGALMLIFTLQNGKTILHTGDFRAHPAMESFPVFWNKDVHTVYLDTTYCNPRYDFPTQDESLEMALGLLRQKKLALEKANKKFSSVLIVCGTYTIGKEKFFLGMARRIGCSVWACPEKDKVLKAVEGRSFCHASAQSCQLHVVPMRDLTVEKLRTYLDSLQGAFTEVVAFKPSGWENGKNSAVEADNVTVYGIPYSEHSSFSEMIRFIKFLKPKQVVPTVDISGGIKAVQKFFPCPLVYKEDVQSQSRVTDYFCAQSKQQVPSVT